MVKKIINKVSDKLTTVGECVNIYFYDNAYMVEVTGRTSSEDYATIKLVCTELNQVKALLEEVESLPRES